MNIGACGIACEVCAVFARGDCPGCVAGNDDTASQKLDAQKEKLDWTCPVLECAINNRVGYCLKDCPQHIPISAYMMYYNEKLIARRSDEKMIRAMDDYLFWGTLAEREATAAHCTECGNCEEACTQHLNIIERLAQMAQWEKEAERIRYKG